MKKRIVTCAVAIVSLAKPGTSYSTTIPAKLSFNPLRNKSKKSVTRSTDRSKRYELPSDASSDPRSTLKNRGWHHRVLRKVFRRGNKVDHLNMQAVAVAEDDRKSQDRGTEFQNGYLRQSFELKSSEDVFQLSNGPIPALVEVTTEESQEVMDDVAAAVEENIRLERGSPYTRITRAWFQNVLSNRLNRWSSELSNLIVQCEPRGNVFQLARGQFHCDATIEWDRAVFENIRLSSLHLEVHNFGLNLYKDLAPSSSGPRYPRQFQFLAKNSTFTQKDLLESSCIRNGLRRLASRILKNRGIVAFATEIKSIKILPCGKISCVGEAATLFGPPVLFEVRSGIDFTSRGHILKFPGLELSFGPSLGLFVPITPEVTVDMGHNAQLLDLKIDPIAKALTFSAQVTITPEHTIVLKNYQQSSTAYGALCSVDVGRWLTRLGRF